MLTSMIAGVAVLSHISSRVCLDELQMLSQHEKRLFMLGRLRACTPNTGGATGALVCAVQHWSSR